MSKDDQIEMHFYINRLCSHPSKRTFVRGALVFIVVSRYGSHDHRGFVDKGQQKDLTSLIT